MMNFDVQTLESDLHRLDCRFSSLRIQQPRVIDRLTRSIEQNGQLVPLVVVAEHAERWVLIDGYQRIEALRRLSRDTARIELWDCPLSQALLIILVRVQARAWEAIEEGAMLRELVTRFDLSQRELARKTGRDVSWINRRLSLVQNLPETLFSAICQGPSETPTYAGSTPPVLSGPADKKPGARGRRPARRARRRLVGGVETHSSSPAGTATTVAVDLCRYPGICALATSLGGDQNPLSRIRRHTDEDDPS